MKMMKHIGISKQPIYKFERVYVKQSNNFYSGMWSFLSVYKHADDNDI